MSAASLSPPCLRAGPASRSECRATRAAGLAAIVWRRPAPTCQHKQGRGCRMAAIRSPDALQHLPSAAAALTADPEALDALVEDAVVWASQHGLLVGAGLEEPACAAVHAPMALLPVPYPRDTFLRAQAAALAFNTMIDAVARDEDYLRQVLAAAAKEDEFTARLLDVFEQTADVRRQRAGSERVLAVLRSDYMLHGPTSSLLQVELNTIASSFGCLSTLVARMHRHLLGRLGAGPAELDALPQHNAMDGIADALGAAAADYGAPGGVVLMVVQPGERNAYDQHWLAARLWERHGVRTLRASLAQLAQRGRLDGDGRLLLGRHPVAVVYFRAGYTPADYAGQAEWDARLLVERSDAYKCPTVALQLAGAKKIQQDLARPGVVERYAASLEDAALLRELFAGQWGLEDLADPDTAAVVADAVQHPERYVLKPQREGGGNNYYGEELREKLRGGRGLAAYILMQRILPPPRRAIMVRNGRAVEAETLSELGIYSTYVRCGDRVLLSAEAGHLVRTKSADSDEGGVAAGFAVLDSPMLV